MLVLVTVELLAVASREEKRVIGAGTEDEHEEYARGLAVTTTPASTRSEPYAAHHGLGEENRQQGQDPEIGLR